MLTSHKRQTPNDTLAPPPAQGLTIGRLAKKSGVHVETVRYYQRRGLLTQPTAAEGYRQYDETHVAKLSFIRRAQTLGFSLEEISVLLRLNETTDHAQARSLALEKIADIESRIVQLQKMATSLQQLVVACNTGGSQQPCPIIGLSSDCCAQEHGLAQITLE